MKGILKKVVQCLHKPKTSDSADCSQLELQIIAMEILYFEKHISEKPRHLLTKWNFGVREKNKNNSKTLQRRTETTGQQRHPNFHLND